MRMWGFRCSGIFLILLIAINFLLTPVFGHVPVFGGSGKSLDTAIQVEDPEKSTVFYGQLTSGNLRYYSFEVKKGERIALGLIVPVADGNAGFTPDMILMGPGLTEEGKIPKAVEAPESYGAKVYSSKLPEKPVYEGFTPSAFYSLAIFNLKAPESGKYYLIIISGQEEGNYGIIIGYEETFTLTEWISIPLNQIKIYQWEGQSLLLIFSPLGLTLLVGLLTIFFKKEIIANFNPAHISGILAGLFFLGTGASLILQMLISLNKTSYSPEIFITLFLVMANLGLGTTALVLSMKNKGYNATSTRKLFYFLGLGIAGLFFWAGWFVGPLLAFEAALLPWKHK